MVFHNEEEEEGVGGERVTLLRCPPLGRLTELALEHGGSRRWALDFVEVLHVASQQR